MRRRSGRAVPRPRATGLTAASGRSSRTSSAAASLDPGSRLPARSKRTPMTSAVFYGPPRSGKTTLARIVAAATGLRGALGCLRFGGATSGACSPKPATVWVPTTGARFSSSTRSTASTRPSRTPSCRRWRPGCSPDRCHHGEPLLRGQLALLPHADLRAGAAGLDGDLAVVVRSGAEELDASDAGGAGRPHRRGEPAATRVPLEHPRARVADG